MPTTAKGLPYPSDTDVPDVPADIEALADAIDVRLQSAIHLATVSVTVSGAVSGNAPVTFPGGLFGSAPRVFVSPVGTTAYGFSASAVTASGCTVTARHLDNTSASATVTCHLLALTA